MGVIMNKKNIILVIFIIIDFVGCLGCAESNTNSVKTVGPEAISTGTIQKEGIKEETSQTNNSTNSYQDVEWENNVVAKVDPMFKTPLANLISSINNRDYISMQSAGTDVACVAFYLLEESKKYNVSPQRQTRKNECEVGWWEMKKAGDYFVSGAKKMQAGDNYGGTLDIDTATNYSNFAGGHLSKAESSGFPTKTMSTEKSSGVIAS